MKMMTVALMVITVRVMMRVITDCVGGGEEKKQLYIGQSEPSAKLSKADLIPIGRAQGGASNLQTLGPPLFTGAPERNNNWWEKKE